VADAASVAFLQWALPRLGLRWAGFANLRGQVVKRIKRRIAELGLADLAAYRARLESDASEWPILDGLCFVTISRFYRDRRVWDALATEVLPELAATAQAGEHELRALSVGCASGEEPYTLSITWTLAVAPRFPDVHLSVTGIDRDEVVLARAREARYEEGTLQELPPSVREQAFAREGERFHLRERFRESVSLRREDIRAWLPDTPCQLILCRNSVFTYLDEATQRRTLDRLLTRLTPGGALVLGRDERLPAEPTLVPWLTALGIYLKAN
jgi:chemotaxis protein methyltransferase CheR